MNRKGNVIDPSHEPKFDNKTLLNMYTYMNLLAKFDGIMYEAQRQGRISFYMQNHGETAAQIGSAAALDSQDLIYGKLSSKFKYFNLTKYLNSSI